MKKEDILFHKGINAFNNRQFYDAHEYWEELWLDYKLSDSDFIQGLIQLAVSYFHLFNQNLKGARSMIKKCLKKIEPFQAARGIDVIELKAEIYNVQKYFNNIHTTNDINNRYLIILKVIHE